MIIQVFQKELEIGKRYWIVPNGSKFSKDEGQFIFKGFKHRKPCFCYEYYYYALDYIVSASKNKFYVEV